MKLWITRDKNGELDVYYNKPIRKRGRYYGERAPIYLSNDYFPSVTFENSPQQIELKLCNTNFDKIIEENKDVLKRIKENGD